MSEIISFQEFLDESLIHPYELPANTPLNPKWSNLTLGKLASRKDSLGIRARRQLEFNKKHAEMARGYIVKKASVINKVTPVIKREYEDFYNPATENLRDRMAAKIEPSVDEMLSLIPPRVWKDPNSTFFDPAMAGGQFVRAISNKLRQLGFSEKNISKRIFGTEETEMTVIWVEDHHELPKFAGEEKTLGNFAVRRYNEVLEGRLPKEWPMKFDVVIGNPPFTQVDKRTGGVTGTIGDKTLYRKFTTKAFDLAKPNGYVSFITLKNVLPHLNKLNKQVDTVNLMTDKDHWKYNTLYFVARNKDRTTPYKIQDKVYDKIFTENGWDVKLQPSSLMQLKRSGIVGRGGVRAIVRLPGEKGGAKRDLVPADKAIMKPKLVFPMLYGSAVNPESNIATDEPILASCSCWIPTRTVRDAQKLRKFILNNPVLKKFVEATKFNRAPGLALKNLKTFDISQIKTGYEIPKEWKLTKEDLKSLGVE